MESVKQQYLSLKEGKMNQAQFMRNVRMSLPQYITNLSSFEDTVKILRNKGILTEADMKDKDEISSNKIIKHYSQNGDSSYNVEYTDGTTETIYVSNPKWDKIAMLKEGIGMFLDPIGYKKSELSDIDKMFTKKFTGTSDKPGHSGYMYDIYKNGKIVKTGIEGEGNANAWINAEKRKLSINEEYGMSLEDAKAEAQRESEEEGVSIHINSVGKGKYQVSYWFDSDSTVASYEDGILTNEYDEYDDEDHSDYFFDVNDEELNETDIYGIAGNPEKEAAAKAARISHIKKPSKYMKLPGENDEEDEINAILKQLEDEEDAKHVMRDKSDFNLKESKTPTGKSLYDHFSEIDRMNGQEVLIGIDYEMEKNPTLTKAGAAKIVIKNLKKIPNYYTNYDMSGVEGYEPEYLGGKSADAEARQMKFVGKDNMVDKVMGMKPVKGIEKIKASANKANKETNKAEDMKLMSLVASTLRGVPKMQSQGEKIKIIRIKEALTRLVKKVIQENNANLKAIASEVYNDIKDRSTDSNERMNIINTKYKKKYNLSDEDAREVHMWLGDIIRKEYEGGEEYYGDYDYEDNN
jgi:hypothetical protein